MVEVIAAVGGAMMTACFVSVGSVFIEEDNQEMICSETTAIELLTTKIDDMHDDMKEVFHRLKSRTCVAEINQEDKKRPYC